MLRKTVRKKNILTPYLYIVYRAPYMKSLEDVYVEYVNPEHNLFAKLINSKTERCYFTVEPQSINENLYRKSTFKQGTYIMVPKDIYL